MTKLLSVTKTGPEPIDPRRCPWIVPPQDAIEFDWYGSVALPANAPGTATVFSFKVPQGRNALMRAFGIDFTANGGAAFTPNVLPVQLVFSLAADALGTQFPGYSKFSFLPGSVIQPTPFAFGLQAKGGQTVTLTVTNNTIVNTTQFVAGRILGWYYPDKREPKDIGYQ